MTARLSVASRPPLKEKPPVRSLSRLVQELDTRAGGTRLEVDQAPQDHTPHGGLLVFWEFWQILGVPDLLQKAGIVKQDGVPAEAVAFLQAAAPLFGKGTVRDAIKVLHQDPALPALSGCEGPFSKQVVHRALENDGFDFEELNWSRVDRLQQLEETKFRRDGLLIIDGSLLRKTSKGFQSIRTLYDHVSDSYRPAYDGIGVVYTRRNVELPVTFNLRILDDVQYQCLQQQKAANKSFEDLLDCARRASQKMPIFIRPSLYSTANLKKAHRAGISWIAQVKQGLRVVVDEESVRVATILRRFDVDGLYVYHRELGTCAAACQVKLPAYGHPVKLFAFRPEEGKSRRAFLTDSVELDERGFLELLHQLQGDFGEDKFALALKTLSRLRGMGCPTDRVAFDEWFFCHDFCGALEALGYLWYTQTTDRGRFRIRGREFAPHEVIRTYGSRATKLRGFPGIRAFKIRAKWVGHGSVQLAVVLEDGRKPYLLVTCDLKAGTSRIVGAYKTRWRVEVFFRSSKQDVNLEGFRVRSLRAIRAHLVLVLLAYTIMKLPGLIDDEFRDKSIGAIKEDVIHIVATVQILKDKLVLIFSDTLSIFERYYIFDVFVRGRARRRKQKKKTST
jgi:hypothetical protein